MKKPPSVLRQAQSFTQCSSLTHTSTRASNNHTCRSPASSPSPQRHSHHITASKPNAQHHDFLYHRSFSSTTASVIPTVSNQNCEHTQLPSQPDKSNPSPQTHLITDSRGQIDTSILGAAHGTHLQNFVETFAPGDTSNQKESSQNAAESHDLTSPHTLPVVDLHAVTHEKTQASQEERMRTVQQLHAACRDVGFLFVKNHGVPRDLLDATMESTREFFNLPNEVKNKWSMDKSHTCRGYLGFGGERTLGKRDCHESVDLYREYPADHPDARADSLARRLLHEPNPWPEEPKELKPLLKQYRDELLRLGATIMSGIAVANGLPSTYFEPVFKESFWTLRLLKYPSLSAHPPKALGDTDYGIGCGTHTDYGFLSFVYQDDNKECLQVQDSQGRWMNADPIPGTFVVNLGDMLSLWSGGLYQSTPHRVQIPKLADRHSLAFFYEPGFDTVVRPEPRMLHMALETQKQRGTLQLTATDDQQFAAKDRPINFAPVRFGDHLVAKFQGNFEYGKHTAPAQQ